MELDTTWLFSVYVPANPLRDWGKGGFVFFFFAYGGISSLWSLLALHP